ncbi:MAG: thioredoxin family protein [Planctomycetota bacterium]|jgi:thioredoxin 1
MAEIIKATDADFDEKVEKSEMSVLVDFFGSWCAPCLKMKPMIEELAAELDGRATVVEVEVSDAPDAAARHDVMGVPTLIVFAGGEVKDMLTGSPSKAEILEAVEPHL